MVPISYFNFNAKLLTVDFANRSLGTITSTLWDFGFKVNGVEQTSTEVNPIGIIFPAAGDYVISLTSTNADGTNTFTFTISLFTVPELNISISQMVNSEFPMSIPSLNIYYAQLVKKWQYYFQSSQGIADADVFDETKWPPLMNVLIAKLVVYDLMLNAQKNLVTTLTNSSISTSTAIASGTKGPLKRIETGPSNAEWFNLSEYWSNILKSGAMNNMKDEICMYSAKLGIQLYFCPKRRNTKIFITGHKCGENKIWK